MSDIIVSGLHRSGTTWIGKVFQSSGHFYYLDEPFHPQRSSNFFKNPVWFRYVESSDDAAMIENLGRHLAVKRGYYWFKHSVNQSHSLMMLLGNFRHMLNPRPVLIKDPLAFFSLEVLWEQFNILPVIVVRHPLAFISSLMRVNWSFDFRALADQPKLMEKLPAESRAIVYSQIGKETGVVDQGIALWKIFHAVNLYYKNEYHKWIFVTHESLSSAPEREFARIFQAIGIRFNSSVKRYLDNTTKSNQLEVNQIHSLKRDSAKNIKTWKVRLGQNEVKKIKAACFDESLSYYESSSWN